MDPQYNSEKAKIKDYGGPGRARKSVCIAWHESVIPNSLAFPPRLLQCAYARANEPLFCRSVQSITPSQPPATQDRSVIFNQQVSTRIYRKHPNVPLLALFFWIEHALFFADLPLKSGDDHPPPAVVDFCGWVVAGHQSAIALARI